MSNPQNRWFAPRNPNVGPMLNNVDGSSYALAAVANQDEDTIVFDLVSALAALADGTYAVALIVSDPTNETTIKSAMFGTIEVLNGDLVTRPALTGTNSNGGTSEASGSTAFTTQSVTCGWGLAANFESTEGRLIVLATIPTPAP